MADNPAWRVRRSNAGVGHRSEAVRRKLDLAGIKLKLVVWGDDPARLRADQADLSQALRQRLGN
ncbi:MAG: hypothetical protein VKM92_08455, partial [Cyanobacteriota bacterium]|nr:hypothetical protein [Cyanobacteriota bacterium]